MAAISQTINNVLGGVSQQPDPVKLPGQVREAVNAYLDPTFGCIKRPGTEFIGQLATDIPRLSKWFPIFRDGQERYISCLYRSNNQTNIRVWNADTAEEANVTYKGNAQQYLNNRNILDLKTLTINDYTLIVNPNKVVTMDTAVADSNQSNALVVVNAVAYNTTYAIDFLRDGDDVDRVDVRQATRLSVEPGSWEVEEEGNDGGSCAFAGSESFVRDGDSDQTGLGFTLSTTCTPTLNQEETEGATYPVSVKLDDNKTKSSTAYFVMEFGYANNYANGSYLYLTENIRITTTVDITLRTEVRVEQASWDITGTESVYRVSNVEIVDYNSPDDYDWEIGLSFLRWKDVPEGFQNREDGPLIGPGTAQLAYEITNVRRADNDIDFSYKSVYRTTVTLNTGGQNWQVGDTINVTMLDKDYTVTVEEVKLTSVFESEASASYTTAADTDEGPLDVQTIVSNLVTSINSLTNYSAVPVGNVIVITRTDDRDFNLQTRGGTANTALYGIKDAVNDVSRLPPQCEDGFVLKVSNSDSSDADDYYVNFKTEGGIPGQGSWVETAKPGVKTDLNPNTMPVVLERDAEGDFTLRTLSEQYSDNYWAPRDAGDEVTNPDPTFVGKTIVDAVFYMNRLGFLSDETIVMSQAGDYFNFFQGSSIAISDADPIDMSVSTTKPAKLKAAVGTPVGLLLFAENSQFLLKTQEVAFGPSTVEMNEITNYAYRSDVQPVETGISILFPTSSDTFSKVFELSIDSLNNRPLVSDNTRIVPEYIPPNLTWCVSAPNNSLVLMGTGDRFAYVFKFYNTGNERNLAGWTKWEFNNSVRMSAFDHDTGFFITRASDKSYNLSRMELLDDPERSPIQAFGTSFTPRLDNYLYEDSLTVTEVLDNLKVTFPAGFNPSNSSVCVIATDSGSSSFFDEFEVQDPDTDPHILVPSILKNTGFIVGISYSFAVTMPSFFVKEGEQNRADRRFPPMVENMYIDLYLSGRLTVDIDKLGYQTVSVDLDVPRSDIYLANATAVESFSTREIPIFCRGDLATVTIKGLDPLPAALTSYSWEGHYSTKGIARR